MIKVKRVDHVGIAVWKAADALPFWGLLGMQVGNREDLPAQGLSAVFLPAEEGEVELLEPTSPDTVLGKALEKRGEGLHHICLSVEDIDGAAKELVAAGVRMIDQAPRQGAGGHRVAFVHPASTHGVLVELIGD